MSEQDKRAELIKLLTEMAGQAQDLRPAKLQTASDIAECMMDAAMDTIIASVLATDIREKVIKRLEQVFTENDWLKPCLIPGQELREYVAEEGRRLGFAWLKDHTSIAAVGEPKEVPLPKALPVSNILDLPGQCVVDNSQPDAPANGIIH